MDKVFIQAHAKPETRLELTGLISIIDDEKELVFTGKYLATLLSDPSLPQLLSEFLAANAPKT